MILVRSSCLTWNHNGNTCIQYPSQWKSSLRKLCGRHHHLVYPYEMSKHQIIMNPFCFTEIVSSLFHRQFFQRRNGLPFENTWFHSSPVFEGVRFFIFLLILDLFTNVICVSWFHPLPSFRWGQCYPSFIDRSGFDHQCCSCPLGSPPVFFCSMVFCCTFCI